MMRMDLVVSVHHFNTLPVVYLVRRVARTSFEHEQPAQVDAEQIAFRIRRKQMGSLFSQNWNFDLLIGINSLKTKENQK